MLTERQKDFLQAVVELAAKRNGAGVHYTDVASGMGVSKWTAYDFLKILASKGYLEVKRDLSSKGDGSNCAGRSKVLFAPTGPALRELGSVEHALNCNFWLQKLSGIHVESYGTLLEDVTRELENVKHPLTFCTGLIFLVLVALKILASSRGVSLPLNFLTSLVTDGQSAIVLFLGSAAALIMHHNPQLLAKKHFTSYLAEYEFHVRDLADREVEKLQDFCQKVLKELWPGSIQEYLSKK